jgi:hypothetical protein
MQTKTETTQKTERHCACCDRNVSFEARFSRGLCTPCYNRLWENGELNTYPRRRTPEDSEIDAQVEEYLKLISPGWNFKPLEACHELEIRYTTMASRLKKRGMCMDGSPLGDRKYRGNYEALVDAYWDVKKKADLTVAQTAERLGVSDRTLYRALAEVDYEW